MGERGFKSHQNVLDWLTLEMTGNHRPVNIDYRQRMGPEWEKRAFGEELERAWGRGGVKSDKGGKGSTGSNQGRSC